MACSWLPLCAAVAHSVVLSSCSGFADDVVLLDDSQACEHQHFVSDSSLEPDAQAQSRETDRDTQKERQTAEQKRCRPADGSDVWI